MFGKHTNTSAILWRNGPMRVDCGLQGTRPATDISVDFPMPVPSRHDGIDLLGRSLVNYSTSQNLACSGWIPLSIRRRARLQIPTSTVVLPIVCRVVVCFEYELLVRSEEAVWQLCIVMNISSTVHIVQCHVLLTASVKSPAASM